MKLAWKVLIGFGIFLVLFSFGMDTTVSSGIGRIHNLGLQQDRQNLLILGCFMFLAGIVLYALKKVKQTPEEQEAEEIAQQSALAVTKVRVEDWGAKADKVGAMLSKVRPGVDGIYLRLSAGVALALLWGWFSEGLFRSSGLAGTLALLAVVYSLWPKPWRTVLTRLMVANIIFLIVAFISFGAKVSLDDLDVGVVLLIFLLPILVSVALILFLRRESRRR